MGFDINPDNAIIVSDKMFSSLYNSSGYNLVIVKVDNIEDVEEARKKIEDRLNKKEEVVMVMELKQIVEGIKSVDEHPIQAYLKPAESTKPDTLC
jgi:putative ABC transport system permease protein